MSADVGISSRSDPTSGPESVRRDTRLLLVSNDAMRARRRPVAVLAYYTYRLVVSLVVAWPISRALAASYGGHPRGDGVLFDDGGWALLALRSGYERVSPGLWGLVTLVTAVAAIAGVVPLAGLLASISHATPETRAPRPRHLAPYVVAAFGPLVYLLALAAALELCLAAVAAWTFGAVSGWAEPRWGEAAGDQIGAAACALVLVLVGVVSVVHDLASASVVRYRTKTIGAIRAAALALRRVPLRLLWSWAWRGAIALALVVVVALVVPRLGSRAASLLAIAALHQLVVLARAALRASWLARALRAVDGFAGGGTSRRRTVDRFGAARTK